MKEMMYEVFGQRRNPPKLEFSELQTQMVEAGLRAIKAFRTTIIISFHSNIPTKMFRDNFVLTLVSEGATICLDQKIPDLMFKVLGWNDKDKVLILRSSTRLKFGQKLHLIATVPGSSLQLVREIIIS